MYFLLKINFIQGRRRWGGGFKTGHLHQWFVRQWQLLCCWSSSVIIPTFSSCWCNVNYAHWRFISLLGYDRSGSICFAAAAHPVQCGRLLWWSIAATDFMTTISLIAARDQFVFFSSSFCSRPTPTPKQLNQRQYKWRLLISDYLPIHCFFLAMTFYFFNFF